MSTKSSKNTPDKQRKYNDAFKAEALHLASRNRRTQADARQLSISRKFSTTGSMLVSWPK